MQMNSNFEAERTGHSEHQQYPPDGINRVVLPAGNDRLLSTPAQNLTHGDSMPSASSELHELSAIDRQPTTPAERTNEVVMAVDVREKGALGCAYYNSDEGNLFLLQDMPCTEPLQLVEMLMIHVQPTMVLLSLKTAGAVLRFLEQHKSTVDQGSDTKHFILRLLGSSEFNHAASLDKLANLPLICPEHALVTAASNQLLHGGVKGPWRGYQDVRALLLGSFIDLDSAMSIGCAGAVLYETMRMRDVERASTSVERSFVTSLQMFSLADFMLVNTDTMTSLHVFQSELHPNTLISGTGTTAAGLKESLSLYGIFHSLAGTFQGRAKLRQLLLRPLVNIDIIRERQKTIAVLLQPGNEEVFTNISQTLRKVADIKKTLLRLQKGAESPTGSASVEHGVWWTLARFSLFVLRLRDAILQLRDGHDVAVFCQVVEAIPVGIIKGVGELIGSIVDFEETKASSRTAVRWNVNPELDKLKQTYHGLDSFLSEVSMSLSCKIPEWARKYVTGCVFWPQLGFLTVVPMLPDTGKAGYEGQGMDDDLWEQRFVANGNVYYKNRRMLELDTHVGDTYSRIADLEVEILHSLAWKILKHEPTLNRASDVCGELDCLVALANGALKYGWTSPIMTSDNVISIRGGRHPLQELTVSAFIPNDCHLVGGSGDGLNGRMESPANEDSGVSMLIVTGPNHSGKSVYIKQVALIVYLAHVGSFVPADNATIGITDQILTRISTRESVSLAESAFGTDLRQVAYLLKYATRRTLVVVDEFGKGTAADDGSGLMTALIDHFTTLGSQTPKVLITTHCHESFEGCYLKGQPRLFLAHMDVRLDMNAEHAGDEVVSLYQLVPGRSLSSFGSRCAALNGVVPAVVERAEEIALLLARREDLGVACARLDAEDESRLEEVERVARKFVQLCLVSSQATEPHHGTNDGVVSIRNILRDLLTADTSG